MRTRGVTLVVVTALAVGVARAQRPSETSSLNPLQLKHISPAEFERVRAMWESSQQVVLLLLCKASQGLCGSMEKQLAVAAARLAAERLPATVQMVDTSDLGGERLRQQLDKSEGANPPTLLLFKGSAFTTYEGMTRPDVVVDAVRAAIQAQPGPADTVGAAPRTPTWSDEQPADAVIDVTTSEEYLETISAWPLVFLLFYSGERMQATLHSNFSAAASHLYEQHVNVRLARMEVRRGTDSVHLAKQLKVHDLPDIKIFRNGIPTDYQAAASTIDIVDVARWNAGNALTRRHNAVSEVNGPAELEVLLNRHEMVLLAFTTRWCSRCLMLSSEFDEASLLLASADPPVVLGSVNIDSPPNSVLLDRFGVLSFPVGKIFHRGRLVGDFMGGTLAHEIVTEMLNVRDELRLAEEATEAGLTAHEAGKDEL